MSLQEQGSHGTPEIASCCFWTDLWKEEKAAHLQVVYMREVTIKLNVLEFLAEV